MSSSSPSAVVIGAGIAGLATALRLRAKGYTVDVYEQASHPGGKMGMWESKGYRFDTGPSLFTMPQLVDQTLFESGCNPREYIKYFKHAKACTYFWEDGTELIAAGNPVEFSAEIAKIFDVRQDTVINYFQDAAKMFEVTKGVFLERSLHRWQTYLSADVFKAIPWLPYLGLFSTLHERNESIFGDENPKLVQLFDRFATYNGSNPYMTPGIMQMICHLEHNIGTYFPMGGMYAIPQALYIAGIDKGINYHFETPVTRIMVNGNKAVGVEFPHDKPKFADVVVSNVDVKTTYDRFLPHTEVPKNVKYQEPSSSAIIFYWGIKKEFPKLDLHNIFFSDDYKEEFDTIFIEKSIYYDPTIYINITSKLDSADAPEDCENWFVMVNVPADSGQDWQDFIARTRVHILNKLKRMLGEDIESLIETENVLSPPLIQKRTSSFGGALYGSSSNKRNAAFFRHPNFQSKIKNLYFCGGSVHPGGGIPLCLHSAAITAKLV
jgi:phytoene desaturase